MLIRYIPVCPKMKKQLYFMSLSTCSDAVKHFNTCVPQVVKKTLS